ncbi:MAG: DNA-3-methyladenine glycosylase family protein [Bilophila wadsworthia]
MRREALDALKRRDKRLGRVIERLGPIRRGVEPDLFTALVDSVIAQQISGRAAQTISDRLHILVGNFTPQGLAEADPSQIQQCGLSQRKVGYIQGIAREVASGALDLEALRHAPDEELIRKLSALNGIGVWTAEMLMIFRCAVRTCSVGAIWHPAAWRCSTGTGVDAGAL